MSSAQKPDIFDEMVEGLDIDTSKMLRDTDLDLRKMGEETQLDIRRWKAMRSDMVKQRESLKLAIKRLDKRIAIGLETIKTIATPT